MEDKTKDIVFVIMIISVILNLSSAFSYREQKNINKVCVTEHGETTCYESNHSLSINLNDYGD